jgi:hypothetical protein
MTKTRIIGRFVTHHCSSASTLTEDGSTSIDALLPPKRSSKALGHVLDCYIRMMHFSLTDFPPESGVCSSDTNCDFGAP